MIKKDKELNMCSVLRIALQEAQGMEVEDGEKGSVHQLRSRNFVACLAKGLKQAFVGRDNVVSMSKHDTEHRARFGLNELLFDVAVFEYDSVMSGKSRKELFFVRKGLWIVESEFAKNKREALFDFNKLVLGCAENKLFIGPRTTDESDYLRVLGEAAKHCTGSLYLALIPHPSEWPADVDATVNVWKWKAEKWEHLT